MNTKIDPTIVHHSRFLSLILRHNPGRIGLTLDAGGWADVDGLLAKAAKAGREFTRQELEYNPFKNFRFLVLRTFHFYNTLPVYRLPGSCKN